MNHWLGLFNQDLVLCDDATATPQVCDNKMKWLEGTAVPAATATGSNTLASQCLQATGPRTFEGVECETELPSICEFTCDPDNNGAAAFEGLSESHNCVAMAKADTGHVFEVGTCDRDAYFICQADQTLKKEFLPYQPSPTAVMLLNSNAGKDILPSEAIPTPPATVETNLGYSSLWSPANLMGYPLFGGSSVEANLEVQGGELTNQQKAFTVMFWFKVDENIDTADMALLVNQESHYYYIFFMYLTFLFGWLGLETTEQGQLPAVETAPLHDHGWNPHGENWPGDQGTR